MKYLFYKTIDGRGFTVTLSVVKTPLSEPFKEAVNYFNKFYPKHGCIEKMSKRDYLHFHNLDENLNPIQNQRCGRIF